MTDSRYDFLIVGKDQTKQAFRAVEGGLKRLRASVNSTQAKFAAGIGVGALVGLTKASLDSVDANAKLADRLQTTIGNVAAFQRITQLSGGSTEDWNKSAERLIKTVGEAERGIGTGVQAFQDLNINVQEFAKLDSATQYRVLAEEITNLGDETKQATIANDIFGRSGVRLINTMEGITTSFSDTREEVKALGLDVDRVDARKVEAANDALLTARQRVQGIGNQLAVQFAPAIVEVSERFVAMAGDSDKTGAIVERVFRTGVRVVGVFADGIRGVQVIVKGAQVILQGFGFVAVEAFRLLIDGAFDAGQAIINFVSKPAKEMLEILAKVSDTAEDALRDLEEMTRIERPEFLTAVDGTVQSLAIGIEEAKGELNALLLEDLPSAVIERKIDEILRAAQARAETLGAKVRSQQTSVGTDFPGSTATQDQEAAQAERERERIAQRLATLEQSYLSELQLLADKLLKENELISQAEEQNLLTEEEALERRLRARDRFLKEREKLEKVSATTGLKTTADSLRQMSGIVGNSAKGIFKIQQAASLAHTAVTLPAAVLETFRNNGGWPWGIVPAAAMAAEGLRQTGAIRGASFGGGGASLGVGGGSTTPTAPAVPQLPTDTGSIFDRNANQVPAVINLYQIAGDVVTDAAEHVTELIKGKLAQGETLLDPDTENFQELVAATVAAQSG